MTQHTFNPVDSIGHGFEWTEDGWYKFDQVAATIAAMRARNAAAKLAKAEGKVVKKFTERNQLISRGGIGSGHPHIELVVTVYGFNAY